MNRLNDILPYIKDQKCGLFIGAGLSKMAGCYDWESIVKKMLDHPLIQKPDLIGKRRNEELIEFCQNLFIKEDREDEFWGIARSATFFDPKLYAEQYLPVVKTLRQIQPTLRVIITTNFDNCLEYSREFDWAKVYYEISHFSSEKLENEGIFHIHGYIEDFKKCLLTRKLYNKSYDRPEFKEFLKHFFSKHCVLFIGYGLGDQEIKDILAETKKVQRKHFLLVPEEDNLSESEINFNRDFYGIITIVYGKKEEFSKIFTGWVNKNFPATSLEVRRINTNVRN